MSAVEATHLQFVTPFSNIITVSRLENNEGYDDDDDDDDDDKKEFTRQETQDSQECRGPPAFHYGRQLSRLVCLCYRL